jgi:hypothetical protein
LRARKRPAEVIDDDFEEEIILPKRRRNRPRQTQLEFDAEGYKIEGTGEKAADMGGYTTPGFAACSPGDVGIAAQSFGCASATDGVECQPSVTLDAVSRSIVPTLSAVRKVENDFAQNREASLVDAALINEADEVIQDDERLPGDEVFDEVDQEEADADSSGVLEAPEVIASIAKLSIEEGYKRRDVCRKQLKFDVDFRKKYAQERTFDEFRAYHRHQRPITLAYHKFCQTMNVDEITDVIYDGYLEKARMIVGKIDYTFEDFFELPENWQNRRQIACYAAFCEDNKHQDRGVYSGSATGKQGAHHRIPQHKSLINRFKELPEKHKNSIFYKHAIKPNMTTKFRVIAVFHSSTKPEIPVLLEAIYIRQFGSYKRTPETEFGQQNPECTYDLVERIIKAASKTGLFPDPKTQNWVGLNGAWSLYQGARGMSVENYSGTSKYTDDTVCKNENCKIRKGDQEHRFIKGHCKPCYEYEKDHPGVDRPAEVIANVRTIVKVTEDSECLNPNCRVLQKDTDRKFVADYCYPCYNYQKNHKVDRPAGDIANPKRKPLVKTTEDTQCLNSNCKAVQKDTGKKFYQGLCHPCYYYQRDNGVARPAEVIAKANARIKSTPESLCLRCKVKKGKKGRFYQGICQSCYRKESKPGK